MSDSVKELANAYAWSKVAETHRGAYAKLCNLHHFRTKTLIEKPISKTENVPLFLEHNLEQEYGEEE